MNGDNDDDDDHESVEDEGVHEQSDPEMQDVAVSGDDSTTDDNRMDNVGADDAPGDEGVRDDTQESKGSDDESTVYPGESGYLSEGSVTDVAAGVLSDDHDGDDSDHGNTAEDNAGTTDITEEHDITAEMDNKYGARSG